jgi:hypothetical protein
MAKRALLVLVVQKLEGWLSGVACGAAFVLELCWVYDSGVAVQRVEPVHATCRWHILQHTSCRHALTSSLPLLLLLLLPAAFGAAAAAAAQLALDFEDGDEVTQLLTIEDELYVMEYRACSTQVGTWFEDLFRTQVGNDTGVGYSTAEHSKVVTDIQHCRVLAVTRA